MPRPYRGPDEFVSVTVSGAEQMRKLAADLRLAGDGGRRLRMRMANRMRATVRPIVNEVKQGLRDIPVKGPASTGLRDRLANATRASVRTAGRQVGVSIIVDGKKMPPGQTMLPAYMEGEARWRHPVFGDTENWVAQQSHPVVRPTVEKQLPTVQAALIEAVDETARALAEGSA